MPAPPVPWPRASDAARVLGAASLELLRALLRRLAGRRRRAAWGLPLELTIAAYRGAWSMLPKLGVVRWREVGEALSPLGCDGLAPRFVELAPPQRAGRSVRGAWLEPPGAQPAVLLYVHGGGFVFGSLRTHGALIGALARSARARAFAVDYRLAPEHPAPAALEDVLAAYRHLIARGTPPERIALAGDSAGGNLVLGALVALRDAGEPLPAAAAVLSPWVDLACARDSLRRNASFDFLGEEHCRRAAGLYLGAGDPRAPAASPVFADLRGLPPLLVHGGEAEVLRDQIFEFAERARAAGVEVQLTLEPDMVHVWPLLRRVTPAGQGAIDAIGAFVRERTGRG